MVRSTDGHRGSYTSAGATGSDAVGSRAHEPPEHDGRTGCLAGSRNRAADRQRAQQRPCGPEFSGPTATRPGRSQGGACRVSWPMPIEPDDIVDRIRDHIKKAPPRKERFDLNEAINEVILLAQSAIIREWSLGPNPPRGGAASRSWRIAFNCSKSFLNLILNAVEAMGSVEAGARESVDQHRATPGGWRPRGGARFRAGD